MERRNFLNSLSSGLVGSTFGFLGGRVESSPRLSSLDAITRECNNTVFDVRDYGAKGDWDGTIGTDNLPAIQRAARALQGSDGGVLLIPKGRYRVLPVAVDDTTAMIQFTSLQGFKIDASEAELVFDRDYGAGEFTVFLRLETCANVDVQFGSVLSRTAGDVPALQCGPRVVTLTGACRNVAVKARCDRVGTGLQILGLHTDSAKRRASGISFDLDMTNSLYGVNAAFNGDDVEGKIRSDRVGRSLFIYGVKGYHVEIVSRNNRLDDAVLGAYHGKGCEDVRLRYQNVNSTSAASAASCVAFGPNMQDETEEPATFRDIEIEIDVRYGESGYPGHALHIIKYGPALDANGGQTYDTQDRGHTFANVAIRGRVEGNPDDQRLPINFDGVWGRGENFHNWTVGPLILRSTGSAEFQFVPLKDGAVIHNLVSDSSVFITSNMITPVTVVNSRAAGFSAGEDDRSLVQFVNCEDGGNYFSGAGKTLINTKVGGRVLNRIAE